MKNSGVEVSIIIPCFNGMRTLQGCLESLLALAEDSPSHEIIMVDNGSNDGSAETASSYDKVTVLFELEQRGPAAARNRGAASARGEILAFIDIDCIVSPNWLKHLVPLFSDPKTAGAGGSIVGTEPKNDVQRWMNRANILDQKRAVEHPFMPYLQTANALFRADAFHRAGGFDTQLICGEDCDLSWRIQKETGMTIAYCPDAVVHHDHRASVRGLYRQSKKNAMAGALLSAKWKDALPGKSWKTSVWEVWDLLLALLRYDAAVLSRKDRSERFFLRLDFLHRLGRKHGMIESAWRTRQWSRW